MISREMSKIETNVLNLIVNRATLSIQSKLKRFVKKLDCQNEVWKK